MSWPESPMTAIKARHRPCSNCCSVSKSASPAQPPSVAPVGKAMLSAPSKKASLGPDAKLSQAELRTTALPPALSQNTSAEHVPELAMLRFMPAIRGRVDWPRCPAHGDMLSQVGCLPRNTVQSVAPQLNQPPPPFTRPNLKNPLGPRSLLGSGRP